MPRPQEVSDEEIREAARKVFLESGTQTAVSEVARTLGVSPATLFLRMGTKENLILQALWPPAPEVEKLIELGVRSDEPVDKQLLHILYELSTYTAAEVPAIFMLYAAGVKAPRTKAEIAEITPIRLRNKLASWLRGARKTGELRAIKPAVAAEVIMGTLEARNLHAFLTRQEIPSAQARAFARELMRALLVAD